VTDLYGTVSTVEQCNAQFDGFTECSARVVADDEVHNQISGTLLVQQTLHTGSSSSTLHSTLRHFIFH